MTGWAAVRLIAAREMRERLRGRAIKISTIVSATVVAVLIVAPSLRGPGGTPTFDVAVGRADTGALLDAIERAGAGAGVMLRVRSVEGGAAAEAAVAGRSADIGVTDADIVVGAALDLQDAGGRERAVAAVREVLRVRDALAAEGIDTALAGAVLTRPPPAVRSLRADTAGGGSGTHVAVAFVGVVALFAFLQQYGSWVAYGVIEEKTTRIVEVLMSAVPARTLLAGKVAGIGLVALGQGLVVAATALVALVVAGDGLPSGVTPARILAPLVWFLLGYAFYCWAFAAAAALSGKQSDLQATLFPVTLPLLIGYFVSIGASFSGSPSTLARVLAYFPPTAPMLMQTLAARGDADLWQALVAGGLTVLATVGMAVLAGNIYARSMLHTGRRLKWREALTRPAG